nr:DUF6516 family protein [Xaviernesmea rhizosphaerae]
MLLVSSRLTQQESVGVIANIKADLLHRSKTVLADGAIIEMLIWRVPQPVLRSRHDFKDSLFYGRAGERIVCFDNEKPKGGHCHLDGVESPYIFVDVDRLIDDFLSEVRRRRG